MLEFKRLNEQILILQDDFRWLSISRVHIHGNNLGEFDPDDFFKALITSQVYHNTYISLDSWATPSKDIHGPFLISRITPKHFRALEFPEFIREFQIVLNDPSYGPASANLVAQIDVFLASLPSNSARCYRLELSYSIHDNDDRYDFHHDWSFVLWEFNEFIVINRDTGVLYLLVFGYD